MVLLALSLAAPLSLDLVRGGPGDADFKYWAVEDTFIDQASPLENFGRDLLLEGGPNKTILIRFGDLWRVIPKGHKVVDAKIEFTRELGDEVKLKSVNTLQDSWGEGPGRRGLAILGKPDEHRQAPPFGAHWRARHAGKPSLDWSIPGARGGLEVTSVNGATGTTKEAKFTINGLGDAVEYQRTHPGQNFGFAIQFETFSAFASSDAPQGKPILKLTLEKETTGPDVRVKDLRMASGGLVATLENVGTEPAQNVGYAWRYQGKRLGAGILNQPLGPGATVQQSIPLPPSSAPEPRLTSATLALTAPGDADLSNNVAEVGTEGWGVWADDLGSLLKIVQFANETLLPQSRFSFAPEGVKKRFTLNPAGTKVELKGTLQAQVRALLKSAGLPDFGQLSTGDLFPGVMQWGDTRDEIGIPRLMPLRYEPVIDPVIDEMGLVPTDLLSATDVAFLNDGATNAKTIVAKLVDEGGKMVANQAVEWLLQDASGKWSVVESAKTSPSGVLILTASVLEKLRSSNMLGVRRVGGEALHVGFLKAWQALDAAKRSGTGAAILTVELPTPLVANTTQDLALDKAVKDSSGKFPAQLQTLVDGSSSTGLEFGEAGWIEVDLGRDRVVAEIRLDLGTAKVWPKFKVIAYGTGQRPELAATWAASTNGAWTLTHRSVEEGGLKSLVLRGAAVEMRFIRIEFEKPDSAVTLRGIRAFPVK